jgi:hypothetical protein
VRGWLPFAGGLAAIVLGLLWTLQGLDLLGGSVMSGVTAWAVIGPVVALAGVILIALALRARR